MKKIHIYISEYMNNIYTRMLSLFIHQHSDCFHILCIVNNAAVNIGIRCVFEILISFPLGTFPLPRSKIAEHRLVLFLILNPQCFP